MMSRQQKEDRSINLVQNYINKRGNTVPFVVFPIMEKIKGFMKGTRLMLITANKIPGIHDKHCIPINVEMYAISVPQVDIFEISSVVVLDKKNLPHQVAYELVKVERLRTTYQHGETGAYSTDHIAFKLNNSKFVNNVIRHNYKETKDGFYTGNTTASVYLYHNFPLYK